MRPRSQSSATAKNYPVVKVTERELLFEGTEIRYYSYDQPEFAIQQFKSNGSVETKTSGSKRTIGMIKNDLSSYLFEYLAGFHIPTHFIRRESDDEMMVRRLEFLPLLVSVYNHGVGELAHRMKISQGTPLEFPIIEHHRKNDHDGGEWLNEYHMYALGIATPEEFRSINRLASKVNAVLRSLCDRRKLILLGLQLEFGRSQEQLYVGGVLSPSTCFIWDAAPENGVKKNRFMSNGECTFEIYQELLDRFSLKE